jgi:hypothetical protein
MKIAELFESELPTVEAQGRVSSGTYIVELSLENLPSENLRQRIVKNIKFVYKQAEVHINKETILTKIPKIGISDMSALQDIYDDIIQTVEETVNDFSDKPEEDEEPIAHGQSDLVFDGVPSFKVNSERVTIKCQENSIGLTGLDKLIGPEVQELFINDIQKLKGHILSLCKIPMSVDVYLYSGFSFAAGDLHHKIEEMLIKHRPNKNVLAFQEELIDNDLKDYAEL